MADLYPVYMDIGGVRTKCTAYKDIDGVRTLISKALIEEEPVYYQYNGEHLPALPEWDKEALPYAYIYYDAYDDVYIFFCTNKQAVYKMSKHIISIEDANFVDYIAQDEKFVFDFEITTNNGLFELDPYEDGDGDMIWSNADIMYDILPDYAFLVVSDPVPTSVELPEKETIEWDGDTTDKFVTADGKWVKVSDKVLAYGEIVGSIMVPSTLQVQLRENNILVDGDVVMVEGAIASVSIANDYFTETGFYMYGSPYNIIYTPNTAFIRHDGNPEGKVSTENGAWVKVSNQTPTQSQLVGSHIIMGGESHVVSEEMLSLDGSRVWIGSGAVSVPEADDDFPETGFYVPADMGVMTLIYTLQS